LNWKMRFLYFNQKALLKGSLIMESEGAYSILEGELRQSLLRGYSRLRRAQAQGRKLDEAERVLELLGDPQVLALENLTDAWKIRMPLVFVADWDLRRGSRVREMMAQKLPARGLTIYKRRHDDGESDRSGIHRKIVDSLNSYIARCESIGGLLLDILWAPRPEEQDHTEITTENWAGFYPANGAGHWLFTDTPKSELPDHIWHINSLVRLTFPLCPEKKPFPSKMITLLLGLAFEPFGEVFSDEVVRKRMSWTRRIARIIIDDIPYLNKKIEGRKIPAAFNLTPPEWLREPQRDSLHNAVDDLHRRVADLANKEGSPSWYEPESGFNFLVAFKELDETYKACLRYRLSVLNLQALGAKTSSVSSWGAELRQGIKRNEEQLRAIFLRGGQDGGTQLGDDYLRECYKAIDDIFQGNPSLDGTKQKLWEMIESTSYPMRLTPGYHVMNLSHPEIIRDWLLDPRARDFYNYPHKLLAWETTVLPPRIYYSQIADGSLPIGICGVNAELLDRCSAYYELQEIIDESGPRFRYILCEEEFSKLRRELRDAFGRTRLDMVWDPALLRFRRLAYYFLASPLDYYTKLVRDSEIQRFSDRWVAGVRRDGRWWELSDLEPGDDVRTLMKAAHVPLQDRWHDGLDGAGKATSDFEEDFIKTYLAKCLEEEGAGSIRRARLHRVKLDGIDDTSLLVLVPNHQNNDLAADLIRQFIRQCDLAAEDHRQIVLRRSVGLETQKQPTADGYDVFMCYNSEDRDAVSSIAFRFRNEGVIPWFDQWVLEPGDQWADALEEQIESIKSAVVFLGNGGAGPWQKVEVNALLRKLVDRGLKIFPVILPGGKGKVKVPLFLGGLQWIDFNGPGEDHLGRLIKAIKNYLESSRWSRLSGGS
jgi:hypothetical protein